jgi:hypothetical protein
LAVASLTVGSVIAGVAVDISTEILYNNILDGNNGTFHIERISLCRFFLYLYCQPPRSGDEVFLMVVKAAGYVYCGVFTIVILAAVVIPVLIILDSKGLIDFY